jgi:hypothetical protein
MSVTPAGEIVAEIIAKIHAGDEIRSWPRHVADAAAEYARSIAPVYGGEHSLATQTIRGIPQAGTFRDSIYSCDAPDYHGLPAAQVRSDLRESSYIEYGTARTPEHATFAKTAAHFNHVQGVRVWVGAENLPEGRDLSSYPTL